MSTPTFIATENLAEEMESWGLHHATYWSSDLNSWGSVSDWDVYFIDKTPGCTKDEAHRSLSLELNILLKKLSDRSRQYSKANALKRLWRSNSDNDSANVLLWNKHLKELESIAISDRVRRRTIKSITIQEEIGRAEDSKNDENYNKQEDDDAIISGMLQVNVCYKFITLPMHIFSDLGNDLREASESMVGKEISQNLGDSIESNDHDSDEDEFGLKDMNLFKQSLVHSFIIDTEDTFIKDEFSEEELSEIVEKKKEQSIPEIDEEILEYIDTFANVSLFFY
ncbi:hypothetical protein RhiirA4_477295 [Rhizophagus irregularis]|uniref:Uncharacterized protein n=1 Tax=Rhizophagus irregularis TaxID=588596 RepID=A0A2I1HD70_9GLOM|nr:hypothetical protein RhiirA4_477295 [Rhizophagus irregularis]